MKKRLLAMLLCLCMVMSLFVGSVTAAGDRVPTAYDGNIEKKATFNPYYFEGGSFFISGAPEAESVWSTATRLTGSTALADLVMVITDAMVVRGEYWYQVEAAAGYELPAEMEGKNWIFQNFDGLSDDYDSLIIQEEPVPEETVPETSAPEGDVPEGDAPGEEAPGEDVPEESIPEETEPEQPEEETPQGGWKSYADFIADQNEKILKDPSVYVGFEAEFNVDRWVSFQYAADPATAVPGSEENILDAADVTDSQGNSIRVIISGYAEDADGYVWYQVEAAEGYTLPDVLAENPYILNLAFPEDPAALNILPLTGMFQGESVEIKKSPEMAGKSETVPTAELPDFFDVTPVKDANGNAYYDLGDTTGWHENLAENGYHYVDASCVILIAPEVTVAYEKLKKADSAKEFDEIWESLPESVREQFTEKHLAVLDRCQEELNNVKYSETVTYNGKELEVSVTGPIPKTGVELSVSPVSDADILNGGFDVKSATEIITALDIKILQENGTEWQPEEGKRIYVSIDMAALGIEDESIVRLHHKHGDFIEVFEVFLVLDGKITVCTGGLSIYTVSATNSTAATGTRINPNSTIEMAVGETKIFYVVQPQGLTRNRRGTWAVTDTSGAIHYTVHRDTAIGLSSDGQYVPWIEITALKETEDVVLQFNYANITYNYGTGTTSNVGSETYKLRITVPTSENGGKSLYLKDMVNTTGSIFATLVDANGKEIKDGLAGAAFSWTRSDGAFIVPSAYGENNQSVNIAKDHGGLVEARKKDGVYVPITYHVDVILADGSTLDADYTVYYQSEIINANFEDPDIGRSSNYVFLTNGWPGLYWETTAPGQGGHLTKDIEFGAFNGASGTEFGVPQAADKATGGTQFAELNAEAVGTLYQDIITAPGEEIEWEFVHAARQQQSWATDAGNAMFIAIGATEDAQELITQSSLTKLGQAAKDKARADGVYDAFISGAVSVVAQDENGASYTIWYHDAGVVEQGANIQTAYPANKNYGWNPISGSYTVPENQYRTRLFFASDTDRPNFGNLIDTARAGQYKSFLIEYYVESFEGEDRKLKHYDEMDEKGEALVYSFVDIENLQKFEDSTVDEYYYYLHKIDINGGNYPYSLRYKDKASLYIERYPGTVTKDLLGVELSQKQKDYYSQYDIVMRVQLRDTVVAVQKIIEFPDAMTAEQRLKLITELQGGYAAEFELKANTDDSDKAYNAVNGSVITKRNPDGTFTGFISMDNGKKQPPRDVGYTLKETATTPLPGLELVNTKYVTTMYKQGAAQTPIPSDEHSTFTLSVDNGTVAEIEVTNIYQEKMTTIYYKAIGNGKVALTGDKNFEDIPAEELAFYSGKAVGANVYRGNGANFVGWFTDEACTVPVTAADGVYDPKTGNFKPNANIIQEDEKTFYAKFETCSITINRENAPNQSFVYHVTNGETGADKIEFFVTLDCGADGKASKTILEVLDGTYTITEVKDWSWRYNEGSKSVTIESMNEEKRHLTATFNGGLQTDDWLSGLAEKIKKNIFKGVATQ